MSKQDSFKIRAAEHGQTVTLYPFLAWPTGVYVDTYSGEPDPDHASYPATRPSPSYDTAVTLKAFFQPRSTTKEEQYIRAVWGEEVRIDARLMVPGDQVVNHLDKVVFGSGTYYVAELAPWPEAGETVYTEAILTESAPRAS